MLRSTSSTVPRRGPRPASVGRGHGIEMIGAKRQRDLCELRAVQAPVHFDRTVATSSLASAAAPARPSAHPRSPSSACRSAHARKRRKRGAVDSRAPGIARTVSSTSSLRSPRGCDTVSALRIGAGRRAACAATASRSASRSTGSSATSSRPAATSALQHVGRLPHPPTARSSMVGHRKGRHPPARRPARAARCTCANASSERVRHLVHASLSAPHQASRGRTTSAGVTTCTRR